MIKIGEVVTNDRIVKEFQCSPQGGMRRSLRTNTLVLVTKHTPDNIYADQWRDGVLDYVGMGREGDQSFDFGQNKTLLQSNTNNVKVHLFEVFEPQQYTYIGRVYLADKPRMEKQGGRMVCVFPLRVIQ